MQVGRIIVRNDRLGLRIELNTDTIVRKRRVGTRDGILAAIFVFEQIARTDEEENATENKHERCQVQCIGKTVVELVMVFAIFRNGG